MNETGSSNLDSSFEKKFSFVHHDEWVLPSIDFILVDDLWSLKNFDLLKVKLNQTKSVLNDKGEKWHVHTAHISKARMVIETIKKKISPDILTQAWCKFFEILSNYNIIPTEIQDFQSFHLCEAPGAFISALNCYLFLNHPSVRWDWLANTLHPYYEGQNIKNVIVDDRLIFPTLRKWHFGKDNTGDILHPNYGKDLSAFRERMGFFDLVTADGSINCLDNPAEQELVVAGLHFAETLSALSNLAKGGSFVLKKFTFFECETICKMYFLNCVFEKVHIFKPFTSKAGNSEVYVICLGYHGVEFTEPYLELFSQAQISKRDKALFPLSKIPKSFIQQLEDCCNFFIGLQRSAILENINLFSESLSTYDRRLYEIQKECADKFLSKCNILFSVEVPRLYPSKKQILTSFYDKENRNCKSLYFQAIGETYEHLTKSKSMDWQDIVLDVEKRLNTCFPASKKRPYLEIEWCFVHKEIMNRMKSKSYKNWFSIGKKISIIQNSKFCNPMLLYLWNRVSNESQIEVRNHQVNECCYWDMDAIISLITKRLNPKEFCIIYMQNMMDENSKKDAILLQLLQTFSHSFTYDFSNIENEETNFPKENRVIYINFSNWENSLHQEIMIKHQLTQVIKNVIKILDVGDTLMICIQSLFTRYTIGIIFMLLSLFEKFVCILPNDVAPPACGQLWIFENYGRPAHTNRLIKYLEMILHLDVPETSEILEVVPIASLCGGHFYEYLLALNSSHMVQRLRNLISIEKSRLKVTVNI